MRKSIPLEQHTQRWHWQETDVIFLRLHLVYEAIRLLDPHSFRLYLHLANLHLIPDQVHLPDHRGLPHGHR